jgi:hypothetical protein
MSEPEARGPEDDEPLDFAALHHHIRAIDGFSRSREAPASILGAHPETIP